MVQNTFCSIGATLNVFGQSLIRNVLIVLRWKYTPHVALAILAMAVCYFAVASYMDWRKGWLSYRIDKAMRETRRKSKRKWSSMFVALRKPLLLARTAKHLFFIGIRGSHRYLSVQLKHDLGHLYLPTAASIAIMLLVLAGILFLPDRPTHWSAVFHPLEWPKIISTEFDRDQSEGLAHLLEGLIVVVIALIVFVAESMRDSKSSDEKRVLLYISKLWILVTLVTLAPIAFLYLPLTGASALLALFMAAITIWGFAQVVRNLLNPETSIQEQRNFLRERVRQIVFTSARQRIGNRLLFELLGKASNSPIEATLSRSFLPGGARNYVYVNAAKRGIVDDIHLAGLEKLGKFLNRQSEQREAIAAAGPATDQTTGLSANAPKASAAVERPKSYLLRRFREELQDESIFSNDSAILAIPKKFADRPGVLEEVKGLAALAFRFTKDDPPSKAFRREMRSTKDRLIAAIQSGSLGEIEELRESYQLVAEEFLTALNTLGGGYSAEQARQERNDFFGKWDEVRLLTTDVRDLLKAAAGTKNADVIRLIVMLPFSIAMRAFQAGDNLLFQEFLSFATYIYVLGEEQEPASESRKLLIDRAYSYLRQFLDYSIGPLLREEDDDD